MYDCGRFGCQWQWPGQCSLVVHCMSRMRGVKELQQHEGCIYRAPYMPTEGYRGAE